MKKHCANAAAFLKHNVGNLFINTRFSKPELLLYHNMGLTTLSAEQLQSQDLNGITIQSMEQGFLESGVGLNNVIRFNYADVGYLGLGLSALPLRLLSVTHRKRQPGP